MSDPQFYKHSGAVPIPGLAKEFIYGALSAMLLAVVYSYLIIYIPVVGIFTLIFAPAFGGLMGLAVGLAGNSGHVRNGWVTGFVGLGMGVFGLWFSWVVWVYAVLQRADVDESFLILLVNPFALLGAIVEINSVGAWSIGGGSPTGGVLWALWALEAALIILPAIFAARATQDRIYCETCERNLPDPTKVNLLAYGDVIGVKSSLEAGEVGPLVALGLQGSDGQYVRADLTSCDGCNDLHGLSATGVIETLDKKGKVQRKEEVLIRNLLLSSEQASSLQSLGPQPPGPVPPGQEPPTPR